MIEMTNKPFSHMKDPFVLQIYELKIEYRIESDGATCKLWPIFVAIIYFLTTTLFLPLLFVLNKKHLREVLDS